MTPRSRHLIAWMPLLVLAGCPFGPREFRKACQDDADCAALQCSKGAADCDVDTECKVWSCTSAVCVPANAPRGTPVSAQTPHDCKKNQCDGSGSVEAVADPMDVAPYGDDCVDRSCGADGTPSTKSSEVGTTCSDGVCGDGGVCVTCTGGFGCASGEICFESSECVSCGNDKKDGHETDVDCGGSDCTTLCEDGKACAGPTDCASNHCIGAGSQPGFCCDDDCIGDCTSCALPGSKGKCVSVPGGSKGKCDSGKACGPMGACVSRKPNGEDCSDNDQCASKVCAAGKCRLDNTSVCMEDSDCGSNTCLPINKTCSGCAAASANPCPANKMCVVVGTTSNCAP